VLVATGYVVARRSSDVGVKTGGRLQTLTFEEGTRVRAGQVIARIEHADLDAQLAAASAAVNEAETQLVQATAQHEEDVRQLERQRALSRDGITTVAALTASDAAAAVSAARVKTGEAAILSARARVRVTEQALENTNVRAPFDGVVIKKRAEVGETVSPFGVAGQSSREGGAIATIADLHELEVQTEVSETSVGKLARAMPAAVKLQAYPDAEFQGRVREIFPSADRAKAIVEVRVTIVNPSADVKPEMTASVTFQQPPTASRGAEPTPGGGGAAATPTVVVSKRAIVQRGGQTAVWVVTDGMASARNVTLGADRLDQVEVKSGLAPGEAVIINAPAAVVDRSHVRVRGA
jgi:RND family efflux transporter MFP subunit